jgi:hypothetical protein
MSKEIAGCIWKGKGPPDAIKSIKNIMRIEVVGTTVVAAVTRIPAV